MLVDVSTRPLALILRQMCHDIWEGLHFHIWPLPHLDLHLVDLEAPPVVVLRKVVRVVIPCLLRVRTITKQSMHLGLYAWLCKRQQRGVSQALPRIPQLHVESKMLRPSQPRTLCSLHTLNTLTRLLQPLKISMPLSISPQLLPLTAVETIQPRLHSCCSRHQLALHTDLVDRSIEHDEHHQVKLVRKIHIAMILYTHRNKECMPMPYLASLWNP